MKKVHFLLLLILSMVLVACGAGDESEDEAESLVVYSGRSESLVKPLVEKFVEETGIEVAVRYGGTAEMAATLLEEGENSPAHIFYAQDPGGLGAVQAEGLFTTLPDTLLNQVPERFRSPEGDWVGVSGRARVVVYNSDSVNEADLPTDLWGFTEPEWNGRIGWAPSNGSFQAMVTGMRQIWGDEKTSEWLQGIQANEPIVYSGNTPIVEAVGSGEVEVGFVNHYYLHRFLAQDETFAARNYFLPAGGPGSLIMVSGVGILEGAADMPEAQQFVEYLLSVEGQQYFTNETFEYPVIDGVTISPALTPLAELDEQAVAIDLADLSDLVGTAEMLSELGILP